MSRFRIQEPLWYPEPSVGLNTLRLEETNEIEIAYKNKQGEKQYPHKYTLTKEKASIYPVRQFKQCMPPMVVVPIRCLNEKT